MKIKIYQINMDRDENHVKFSRHELLEKYQGTSAIDASLYDEVFSGEVECSDLEGVYTAFNTQPQPLHRGHSLSVSDIVVNEDGAYFCDSFGFKKVDFDESQTQKPDNLLKIVYVEPHKAPVIAEIEDTSFAFQRAVLGGFEEFWNENGTVLLGNRSAKLDGMDGNRRYCDGEKIVAGPFFAVGVKDDGECFRSLTDEEAQMYMERFAEIEDISQEEVEADMGFNMRPW